VFWPSRSYPAVGNPYPIVQHTGKRREFRPQWLQIGDTRAAHVTDIAAALQRVEKILLRSPKTGLHVDAPATARWNGGTEVTTTHENGTRLATDLPTQMGGGGTAVTPGWLLRAGLASCVTTRIAMAAAVAGIELTELEVVATSQSDARGLLGMADADGQPVPAGPRDLQLHVKIAAADSASAERLRSLVEQSHGCSPVSCAVQDATAIELLIEAG
jgi:uncharacterized OsmC-like protein